MSGNASVSVRRPFNKSNSQNMQFEKKSMLNTMPTLFYYNFASPPWPSKQGSAVAGASAKDHHQHQYQRMT
jgi:hypothetical protein